MCIYRGTADRAGDRQQLQPDGRSKPRHPPAFGTDGKKQTAFGMQHSPPHSYSRPGIRTSYYSPTPKFESRKQRNCADPMYFTSESALIFSKPQNLSESFLPHFSFSPMNLYTQTAQNASTSVLIDSGRIFHAHIHWNVR